MSKYHPLDVRHPANRDRERNSYLLAPADEKTYALRNVERAEQAPSRRSADYRSKTTTVVETPITVPTSSSSPVKAPWGATSSGGIPTLDTAPRRSWVPKLIAFGVIAYVILNSLNLTDQIGLFVSRTLYELGIR